MKNRRGRRARIACRAGAQVGACHRRRRPSSAARVPVVVTLAIFALAFLLPAWPWLSGAVTIPWDAKSQFFPQVQFLASSLARGEWPWWSPNVFAGWAQDLRSAVAAVLAAACASCRIQFGGQPARIRCGDLRLSVSRWCRHHPVLSRPRMARGRGAGRRDGICTRWFRQCAHAAHRPDHQPGLSAARTLARRPRARAIVLASGSGGRRARRVDGDRTRSGRAVVALRARRFRAGTLVGGRAAAGALAREHQTPGCGRGERRRGRRRAGHDDHAAGGAIEPARDRL